MRPITKPVFLPRLLRYLMRRDTNMSPMKYDPPTSIEPLQEGTVRKGGHNDLPRHHLERPAPPPSTPRAVMKKWRGIAVLEADAAKLEQDYDLFGTAYIRRPRNDFAHRIDPVEMVIITRGKKTNEDDTMADEDFIRNEAYERAATVAQEADIETGEGSWPGGYIAGEIRKLKDLGPTMVDKDSVHNEAFERAAIVAEQHGGNGPSIAGFIRGLKKDGTTGEIGVQCTGAIGAPGETGPTRKYLVEVAGVLYGPFDNAGAAAEWFTYTRPEYAAPWKIITVLAPDDPRTQARFMRFI